MPSTKSARNTRGPRTLVLEGVVLYTRDLERAKAFYRDSVGLPVLLDEEHVVHFDAVSVRLAVHRGEPPEQESGFLVLGVEDIDAAYEALRARGVTFDGPIADRPHGRVAYFRDPDGHRIALWESPAMGGLRPLITRFERVLARLRDRTS